MECKPCCSSHGRAHAVNDTPSASAKYFCPMCPGVEIDKPGTCPRCGMALEAVAGRDEDDSEMQDITRRFRWSALLTLPVFLSAMAHLVPAWQHSEWADGHAVRRMQFLLTTPVVFWGGWPFFVRA